MTTVRVTEEEKKALTLEGVGENGEKWYSLKPFYYKENEFGTWEIYSKAELPKKVREGIDKPKHVYENN